MTKIACGLAAGTLLTSLAGAQDLLDTISPTIGGPIEGLFEEVPEEEAEGSPAEMFGAEDAGYTLVGKFSSALAYDTNITANSAEVDGFFWANQLSLGLEGLELGGFTLKPTLTLTDLRHDHLSTLDKDVIGLELAAERPVGECALFGPVGLKLSIGAKSVYTTTFDSNAADLLPLSVGLSHKKALNNHRIWASSATATRTFGSPAALDSWSFGLDTKVVQPFSPTLFLIVGASATYTDYDQFFPAGFGLADRQGWLVGGTLALKWIIREDVCDLLLGLNAVHSSNDNSRYDYDRLTFGPNITFTRKF